MNFFELQKKKLKQGQEVTNLSDSMASILRKAHGPAYLN